MQRILNRSRSGRVLTRNTVRSGHLAVRTNVLGDQTHKLLRQLVCLGKRTRQVIRTISKRGIGRTVAGNHSAQRGAQRAHKSARAATTGNWLARGQRLGKTATGFIHHLLAHTHTHLQVIYIGRAADAGRPHRSRNGAKSSP